jgi:hypothetical protein
MFEMVCEKAGNAAIASMRTAPRINFLLITDNLLRGKKIPEESRLASTLKQLISEVEE